MFCEGGLDDNDDLNKLDQLFVDGASSIRFCSIFIFSTIFNELKNLIPDVTCFKAGEPQKAVSRPHNLPL